MATLSERKWKAPTKFRLTTLAFLVVFGVILAFVSSDELQAHSWKEVGIVENNRQGTKPVLSDKPARLQVELGILKKLLLLHVRLMG
jgi:hypothetical protein